MKKGDKMDFKPIVSYVVGIVAIALALFQPFPALILSVVGLVQSSKQKDMLSKRAKILSIVALIVSVILVVVILVAYFQGLTLPTY